MHEHFPNKAAETEALWARERARRTCFSVTSEVDRRGPEASGEPGGTPNGALFTLSEWDLARRVHRKLSNTEHL